jgi:hypothetical protein
MRWNDCASLAPFYFFWESKMLVEETKAVEARARRAAKRAGFIARKSRARVGSVDNLGGFMLVNEYNHVVDGSRFDLSAHDVIAYFAPTD